MSDEKKKTKPEQVIEFLESTPRALRRKEAREEKKRTSRKTQHQEALAEKTRRKELGKRGVEAEKVGKAKLTKEEYKQKKKSLTHKEKLKRKKECESEGGEYNMRRDKCTFPNE